jgi:KTSC domain
LPPLVEFNYVAIKGARDHAIGERRQPRCVPAETIGVGGHYVGYAAIMIKAATSLIVFLMAATVGSETINVSGHGVIDLDTFECRDITRSSIVQRVCYDPAQRHLIVAVKGAYGQYCDLPAETFDALMGAPSMGQFFNRNIRSAPGTPFACGN